VEYSGELLPDMAAPAAKRLKISEDTSNVPNVQEEPIVVEWEESRRAETILELPTIQSDKFYSAMLPDEQKRLKTLLERGQSIVRCE
jgi:hypothetical protein